MTSHAPAFPLVPLLTNIGVTENLGYLHESLDLTKTLMEVEDLTEKKYKYLNLTAVHILSILSVSQSIGSIESGFKNLKAALPVSCDPKGFPPCLMLKPPMDGLPYATH